MVERLMATLKKTVQQAELDKTPMWQTLGAVLRAYRYMPHSTIGTRPSILMLGREVGNWIPWWNSRPREMWGKEGEDAEVRAWDL